MRLKNTLLSADLSKPDTHRQGVDKQTKGPVRSLPALHATKQNCAEHRVLLTRAMGKHQAPGHVEKTRRTDTQRASSIPQPFGQATVQPDVRFADPRTITPHIHQAERRSRFVNIPQHLAEKRFMLLTANSQPCLRNKIAERQSSR